MSNEERVVNPISTKELERRWAAVRAAMSERGIDVLIMQNSNEFHGGYVKYFTDIPARHGGYETVIFPIDDKMSFLSKAPAHPQQSPLTASQLPFRIFSA